MTHIIANTKLDANSFKEVIETLGNKMIKEDYVKESYVEAVLERETTMPTALKTGFINVAIPHTDVTHVNESAISIATLNERVNWHLMEDPAQEVEVEIVFLLAVKEPSEQTELLKKLMSIFQNKELLDQIRNAEDENSLNELLKSSVFKEGII